MVDLDDTGVFLAVQCAGNIDLPVLAFYPERDFAEKVSCVAALDFLYFNAPLFGDEGCIDEIDGFQQDWAQISLDCRNGDRRGIDRCGIAVVLDRDLRCPALEDLT